MTTLTAIDNASAQPSTDTRRISELDADYQRLQRATERKLTASIRQLVRDLRTATHPETVLAPFIARHTQLLRDAYDAAHTEGQRDYYERVSARPNRWLRDVSADATSEATARTRLAFYGVSASRMAAEALQAHRASVSGQIATTDVLRGIRLASASGDALDDWAGGVDMRISLQADIVWSGLQDGYLDGGRGDRASLYALIYWLLEPLAQHCDDCLAMAAGSPYNAVGLGGNDLKTVPGDGHTACGARCKCSLSLEPQGALDQKLIDRFWNDDWRPRNAPDDALPQVSVPPPADDTYTRQQKQALDRYRDAAEEWDTVRGILPRAPGLFSTESGDPEIALPLLIDWDYLEPDQQEAMRHLYGAVGAWDAATKYGADDEEQ